MKISASGLHLADCALPHAVWFGHNPSLCLEVVATPAPHPLPPPYSEYIELSLNFIEILKVAEASMAWAYQGPCMGLNPEYFTTVSPCVWSSTHEYNTYQLKDSPFMFLL